MKNLITLLLLVSSTIAFSQTDDCAKFDQLIDTYVKAWNDEDTKSFEKVCHKNVSDDKLYNDINGLAQYAQAVWSNYENTEFRVYDKACGTNHVSLVYSTSGFSKEYQSDYTGTGMLLLKIKDDKISEIDGVLDIYQSLFAKGFKLTAADQKK